MESNISFYTNMQLIHLASLDLTSDSVHISNSFICDLSSLCANSFIVGSSPSGLTCQSSLHIIGVDNEHWISHFQYFYINSILKNSADAHLRVSLFKHVDL